MAEKAEKKDAVEAEAKATRSSAAKSSAKADKAGKADKAPQEGRVQAEDGCRGIPPRRAEGAPPPSGPRRQHREDPRGSR